MKKSDLMPFDVDRWRSDQQVALLRPVSRYFWLEAICVMWKSGRNGVLSGSFNDLASLCRVSPAEARASIEEIKARNTADVTECNGVVTLVCRGMKRDFDRRVNTRQRVGLHRLRRNGNAAEIANVTQSVTQMKHTPRVVTPPPSLTPSPFSPPTTPSYTPPPIPPSPISFSAENERADVVDRFDVGEAAAGRAKQRERKLTADELATRTALTDWWINDAWPKRNGGLAYDFATQGGRNAKAVLTLLRSTYVKWDLTEAKKVCSAYLDAPAFARARPGRPLFGITDSLDYWASLARNPNQTNGNNYDQRKPKPTAAERGHFAESVDPLPEFR